MALLCVALSAAMAHAGGPTADWSRIPPPLTDTPYVVADSVHHRFLLLGGPGGNNPQVWALSLDAPAHWTDLHASNAPTFPVFGSPVNDPFGDRVLFVPLFGLGDQIQQLPLGTPSPAWSTLATQGTPPADLAGAVYDRGHRRLIAWECTCNTCVHQLDLTTSPPTWSTITVSGSGSGLCIKAAVYDPIRNRIVGFDDSGLPWALPLGGSGQWSRIFPVGTPPPGGPVHSQTITYDPIGDRVLVFAGTSTILWGLALASPAWQMMSDGSDPSIPQGGECAYDPVGRQLIAYGNISGTGQQPLAVAEAFELEGPPAWSRLTPLTDVSPGDGINASRMVVDPVRDRLLYFENYTFANGGVPRLWARSLADPASEWQLLVQSGSKPPHLVGSSIVYDPPRDRFLYVFGNDGTFANGLSDVWALDPATVAWTHLLPDGTPPPGRARAGAAYDPVRDQLVVFGGQGTTVTLNDTWTLSLSGIPAWTHLIPSGTPPTQRSEPFLGYDPLRDVMTMFGGSGSQETWRLSLGGAPAWTLLSPSGSPSPDGRAYFDPVRDRLVAGPSNFTTVSVLQGGTAWDPVSAPSLAAFLTSSITGANAPDFARDRWIIWENDLRTLGFGGTALPSVIAPAPAAWTPGTSLPLSYRVRNPYPYAEHFAWSLASQRNWPGMPLSGVVTVPANDSVTVPVSVPVPDTAAAGLNSLVFRATSAAPLVTATGSNHIHDVTTPAQLALARLDVTPGRVSLAWWAPDLPAAARVERREAASEWKDVGAASASADLFTFTDDSVVPAAHYGYRLRLGSGPDATVSAEVLVAIPGRLDLALALGSNPGGRIVVSLTLPTESAAKIQLVDLGGRRILDREIGSLGAGSHRVELTREGEVAPGVYFVRLTQSGRTVTRRAVVIR